MCVTLSLEAKFRKKFGRPTVLYRAPGRVNLIGEHTDYNGGWVLPAAIGFSCQVAGNRHGKGRLAIHSETFQETVEGPLDVGELHPLHRWSDYAVGVAWALQRAGYTLQGASLLVESDIPLGAGLSSSAAFEVAVACCLLDLSGHRVDRSHLARLCQRAENEFAGARCGIMDQFICCHGRSGNALLLDCRTLDHRLVPFPADLCLVVCNTMVKHEHGTGEYNIRREECEEGVRRLGEVLPGISALRDVSLGELERHADRLPEVIYKRCRHVITENDRVGKAAEALERGDTEILRKLMAQSHRSLRDDYEVSCAELDQMVELAEKLPGVCGARMTGGGFGGCTVNLVRRANAGEFKLRIAAEYQAATSLRPDIFICDTSDGVRRLRLESDAGRDSAIGCLR